MPGASFEHLSTFCPLFQETPINQVGFETADHGLDSRLVFAQQSLAEVTVGEPGPR